MTRPAVHGETVLWEPNADSASGSLGRFLARNAEVHGIDLSDYRAGLDWSTRDLGTFWDAVRRWFDLAGDWDGPALADDRMPGAVWYPQARVNFAENLLRHASGPSSDRVAIVDIDEDRNRRELTWRELADQVFALADSLRELEVVKGDRVAAVLPNIPEAIIGLLASASIGAVWCVCSPDLSAPAAIARLSQLDAKVLIGSLGYRFAGKWFDRRGHLDEVLAALPSVEHVIEVGAEPSRTPFGDLVTRGAAQSQTENFEGHQPHPGHQSFERVAFDHPLWVLFTSGTTGKPKGIIHGHGGMTLESVKAFGLQFEMTAEDRYYVAANTSWMVWNTLVMNLMTGASVVTSSGSPTYPQPDQQFDTVASTGATMFATGAAYLKLVQDSGFHPQDRHDLSALTRMMTTGSTLSDSTALWIDESVRTGIRLADSSGGTDICSAFVGGNPLEPVRLGRMQGAWLGVSLDVFDSAGRSVRNEVGELVITRPMPSMPVTFLNDPDGSRYHDAYFSQFPGAWSHGDWIIQADDGTCEVLGRSDATLNRAGVRLGSSEIYSAVATVPGIRDSLVIGVDLPNGGYWMPLFVVLDEQQPLDADVESQLVAAIRSSASARHVPDEIIAVPEIPLTHAGKKIEVPIKRLFMNADPDSVDRGALTNPRALDWFVERARIFNDQNRTQSSAS